MTNWENRLFDTQSAERTLPQHIDALLTQQRRTWELFRNGEASLSAVTTKEFIINGIRIVAQANPGRSISTNAKVDPGSIAQRPCFLCPDALPEAERGIAQGNFVLLPNPYPILPKHMTIAFKMHSPQKIDGHVNNFIALTKELGSDMFILYNGPCCGASAPDHMHFQTAQSSGVPLFQQLKEKSLPEKFTPLTLGERNLFAGCFNDCERTVTSLERLIATYRHLIAGDQEPMLNIVARYADARYTIAVFPRAKHRSACYFAPEEKRLSISPAAIEMAGIVVVADVNQFNRVDEKTIRDIYREVTIESHQFNQLAEEIA